jgi:hypothetical protein
MQDATLSFLYRVILLEKPEVLLDVFTPVKDGIIIG